MTCAECGQPASRRSGIVNKVYRRQECHAKVEKRGWTFALVGCGGAVIIIALLTLAGCGTAAALVAA